MSPSSLQHAKSKNIVLVPQPSNSPLDPLNWSESKKYFTLFIVCFSAFGGATSSTAHQLAYVKMAPTYHRKPIELEYSISAAIAGLLGGPIFFIPLAHLIGRTSLVFWTLLASLLCQIWAATATSQDEYISMVISRLMAGMFSAVSTVIGSAYIIDIFFLHQRGVAFTCYELSLLLGFFVGPTLGGFIVQHKQWPVVFWWTLAPLGLAILLVAAALEDTYYDRTSEKETIQAAPLSFFRRRLKTLLLGSSKRRESGGMLVKRTIAPFVIAICPGVAIVGFYTFIAFGFNIALSTLLTIFLQTPVEEGGYSFTAFQNAAFSFTSWVSVITGQITGWYLGDRLPLYASKRFGSGIWRPEFRLANICIPAVLMPIGLGLFGAGLQYHLHYMVLALALFLVNFSAFLSVPICVNYAVECFKAWALEASVAMNTYRLAFGVALPFFVLPWEERVGSGWLFGMAAFFCLFGALLLIILALKGHALRSWVLLSGLTDNEEGARIIDEGGKNSPDSSVVEEYAMKHDSENMR